MAQQTLQKNDLIEANNSVCAIKSYRPKNKPAVLPLFYWRPVQVDHRVSSFMTARRNKLRSTGTAGELGGPRNLDESCSASRWQWVTFVKQFSIRTSASFCLHFIYCSYLVQSSFMPRISNNPSFINALTERVQNRSMPPPVFRKYLKKGVLRHLSERHFSERHLSEAFSAIINLSDWLFQRLSSRRILSQRLST